MRSGTDNLERLVGTLTERVERLRQTLVAMGDLSTRVALLEHQVAELKKAQEKWGRRLWMLLAPLAGAVVGALLTYYLQEVANS
jgi:hypothetical protein